VNCGSGFLEYVRCRLDACLGLTCAVRFEGISKLTFCLFVAVAPSLCTCSIILLKPWSDESFRFDPHALTNTHCGHSFCCLCIIRHILDSLPPDIPNPALAPELIQCPSCEIDGSPPGSPSPSPSPGSRRGLISRQTTLASVVSSVYETLLHEEVDGWVPPDESKRALYDQRARYVCLSFHTTNFYA
jgi:hypothetical protein